MSEGTDRQITRRLVEKLPNRVKRGLAGPYNRWQAMQADRTFNTRSLPQVSASESAPEHVVCIVVDALRADAIRTAAPFLQANHTGDIHTAAPWTFPAVCSLVTGLYPHEHGAMRQSDESTRTATELVLPPALDEDLVTLPEVYAGAGYATYGGFAFHMPFFALQGRFETHSIYDNAPADTLLDDFVSWFDGEEGRTFSYLHLGDLHEPVDPPNAYWERFEVDDSIEGIKRWRFETDPDPGTRGKRYIEHRRRLYQSAVAYVDDQLQALFEQLPDGTAILVTADHGEGLWEWTDFDAAHFTDSRPAYGIDHGGTPYEQIARVPLITSGIDLEPNEDGSIIDIAPSLLKLIGVPDAMETTGGSLATAPPADRIRLVEAARYGFEKKAVYVGDWKLLVSKQDDAEVGFNLPDETIASLPASVNEELRDALPAWPDGSRPDRPVSGIARDRLEDLGYV